MTDIQNYPPCDGKDYDAQCARCGSTWDGVYSQRTKIENLVAEVERLRDENKQLAAIVDIAKELREALMEEFFRELDRAGIKPGAGSRFDAAITAANNNSCRQT